MARYHNENEMLHDERGRPVAHSREPSACVEPSRSQAQPARGTPTDHDFRIHFSPGVYTLGATIDLSHCILRGAGVSSRPAAASR